jgi:hypothetical protein
MLDEHRDLAEYAVSDLVRRRELNSADPSLRRERGGP